MPCWCNPDYCSRWKEIEGAMSDEFPIQAAIGDKDLLDKLKEFGNPWICVSLKIWSKVIAQSNLKDGVKVLRWCAFNTDFFAPQHIPISV